MAIFELRSNGKESRIFLTELSEPEWTRREEQASSFPRLLGSLEAQSWVSAKKAFGFELTPIQTRILAQSITHFELFGHHWSASDMADYNAQQRKRT